ncbi:sigma 54-interacting transcriptional regulator [Nitratidesulfovibrio termitidis]|uniref:sigma 54-interacting transcriptional regulator n=1 Tax=Nitratidesulfovibrio termitidis TaxID=42252 RepID=UPI00041D469D|nr:sigma 54-interacting transcriptional regulator [Nitratidesulfovibrio termitidis]
MPDMGRSVFEKLSNTFNWFRDMTLKGKLMLALLPPVVLTLAVTGYLTHLLSNTFIQTGLERIAAVQTQAMARQVEDFLGHCRQDLLIAEQQAGEDRLLRGFLERRLAISGTRYCELAKISQKESGHTFFVINDGEILTLPENRLDKIHPNPFLFIEKLPPLEPGEVWISPVMEVEYPFPSETNPNRKVSSQVIRMATPYVTPGGERGHLLLALDVRQIRDILSLYSSAQSPLRGVQHNDEILYSFMFDTDGWELFQSEDIDKQDPPLATYLARAGFEGTLGNPYISCAFRPSSLHKPFWRMVREVSEGRSGLATLTSADFTTDTPQTGLPRDCIQAYAPVRFTTHPGQDPVVYAGIATMDRSQLTLTAGYRHIDIMLLITLCTIALITALVYLVSRVIAKPILKMTHAVSTAWASQEMTPVDIPHSGYETGMLRDAVNKMIERMRHQSELIRSKDEALRAVNMRRRAVIDDQLQAQITGALQGDLPEFCGLGPKMEQLKGDVLKAARVDVDVLIVGETGTGKQLTAEAIHRHSRRSGGPFICVDCGALDENLLLDTLFGHVKWAFTEAKSERKGAFLNANFGTLFLDEIQTASPKVQQALLRAVAMRKIKPLGSDSEIDVDVRIIAATNVSLEQLIERKTFREDLYFRLKVITLSTPPLREHKESIPLLAVRCLVNAENKAGKQGLGFSNGAIDKLMGHDWPGNVREFINRITNAAVMAESNVIQAEDIVLEGDAVRLALAEKDADVEKADAAGGLPGDLPSDTSGDVPGDLSPDLSRNPLDGGRRERADGGTGHAPNRMADSGQDDVHGMAGSHGDAGGPGRPLLNKRQQRAYERVLARGSITRQEYQDCIGGKLPVRTANHDLHDMVRRQVLDKVGQGPSTRYVLAHGAGSRAGDTD